MIAPRQSGKLHHPKKSGLLPTHAKEIKKENFRLLFLFFLLQRADAISMEPTFFSKSGTKSYYKSSEIAVAIVFQVDTLECESTAVTKGHIL